MSKRPSATNNDPGYLYNQKRLLQIFTASGIFLGAMLALMIWVDFDRPWKDVQKAEQRWEADRMTLEVGILDSHTRRMRENIASAESKAEEEIAAQEARLEEIRGELTDAEGSFYAADMAYKEEKQFVLQAQFQNDHAKTEADLAYWGKKLREEKDKEIRLEVNLQNATVRRNELSRQEKEITGLVAAAKERAIGDTPNPELRRKELIKIQLLSRGIEQKAGYNPLREIPLTDFLAPPVKVEQVVLQHVSDNYESATPKKVDRCATCHMNSIRLGYEADMFPVELLEWASGSTKKIEKFEEGVYNFVFSLLDGVWPKVPAKAMYRPEKEQLRKLEIHHETLRILFEEYDDEEGYIESDEKTKIKKWRRWALNEDGTWIESNEGKSIGEMYLDLLFKMRGKKYWRTHPHFDLMVGDSSPHPYGEVGCTICHGGRGWSTDFGYALHTPELEPVEDWMTTKWWEERAHGHMPLDIPEINGKPLTVSEAMQMGIKVVKGEPHPLRRGYVMNEEQAGAWKKIGRTKTALKYAPFPQLPTSLVQASCMKCHGEGVYYPPEPEYPNAHLGPPDPGMPDTFDYEVHAEEFNDDPDLKDAGQYEGRLFIPKKPEKYEPETLFQGMANFIDFGCYGCHKVDEQAYPFMVGVREKVGPDLDLIFTKTTREFMQKWVQRPSSFRPKTQMPQFWGLSNNSHDFEFRFAKEGYERIDGKAWGEQEIYAVVEYVLEKSKPLAPKYAAIDLSKGDPGRGERIVVGFDKEQGRAKACVACHTIPISNPALKIDYEKLKSWYDPQTKRTYGWGERMSRRHGPDLAGIGSKVDAAWLAAWLRDPHKIWPGTVMPDLRLTEQEILDVTAYLMTLKNEEFEKLPGIGRNVGILKKIAYQLKVGEKSLPTNQEAINAVDAMSERDRTLYVGGKLVKHYGCFGCHNIDEYKTTKPIGTELTKWGSKHVDRLEFKHVPVDYDGKDFPYARFMFAYTKLQNPRIYDYGDTRANSPYERLKMPRFGFSSDEARSIAIFLISLVDKTEAAKIQFQTTEKDREVIRGREIVAQRNCQGCHIIEREGGDVWPAISEVKWQPPDLLGQGMKTQPDWLFKFMKEPYRLRPWHSINMPTFHLTDEETRAIVAYFARMSEVPYPFEENWPDMLVGKDGKPVPYATPKTFQIKDPKRIGKKMRVTAKNALEEARHMFAEYACESCHAPEAGVVPEGNRAPVFTHVRDGRLRQEWMRYWLYDPKKLQAGTAMPGFFPDGRPQSPEFFDGDTEAQIRALIAYLTYHYTTEGR